MDPLETRSLPNGLWRHVPSAIVDADVALQQSMEPAPGTPGTFRQKLEWMTADPQGISLSLALLVAGIAALWFRRRRVLPPRELARELGKLVGRLALAVPFVAASDLASSRIKLVVGRLKPHVNFYNPAFTPALSFPSNHAFNSAFALALFWFSLPPESRRAWRGAFGAATFLLALVGLSRIWFGQHYPLDVAAGWIIGGAFGRLAARLYGWISFRTVRR